MKKIFTFLTIFLSLAFVLFIFFSNFTQPSPTENAMVQKLALEEKVIKKLHFQLLDPEQAPEPLKAAILQGYHIMLETKKHVPEYAGDKISCTNCHFGGGDTTGGENSGISLAGVAAKYPKFNGRSGEVIDLPTRINSCFERSLNGKPLPLDSKEMLAIVTYLHWISKGIPIYGDIPWLGLPELISEHHANAEDGKNVYQIYCASCHGGNGNGEIENRIPPLWGENSFNDGAGMNDLRTLASFIYWNMPFNNRELTVEQALDVAAFIIKQPRPKFKPY